MKKYVLDLTVRSSERLNDKYVLLKLTHESPLPTMLPGQFVEVRVDHSPTTFLRRPISIHFVDEEANELWLLVAMIGDGTRRLGLLQKGEVLNGVLPLGNAFTMREAGMEPTFLLGARSKGDLLELDNFKKYGRVFVTTEDGSEGERGFVTQHSLLDHEHFDSIATCGPKPMMVAVARYATKTHTECEASLENLMACGLGACLCCVEKTTEGNVCVCKEGPVMNINRLLWQI